MKKAISILLVLVLCLSMCACGGTSKEIKLTTENIEDYLDFEFAMYSDGDYEKIIYHVWRPDKNSYYQTSQLGTRAVCLLKVAGVSQNYNYSDISVTIRITGKYAALKKSDVSNGGWGKYQYEYFTYNTPTIQLDLNVSGIGESKFYYQIPNNLYAYGLFEYDYEIIEVTGTIAPLA